MNKPPFAKMEMGSRLFSQEVLDTIDENTKFEDPYFKRLSANCFHQKSKQSFSSDESNLQTVSNLNLSLSQKTKKETPHCSNSRKWSTKLQQELLHKVAPVFQKHFPQHHLEIHTLKKSWKKINDFSTQIQGQREAFTKEGKVNFPFFIKQNLKLATKLQNTCHLHPCHYAHQIAVKMREYIATVDEACPKLDQLTKTIWLLQRHLVPNLSSEECENFFNEQEKIDAFIVKEILEIVVKQPEISQAELGFHVQKKLAQLHFIMQSYSLSQIKNILHILWIDQWENITQKMEKLLNEIPYSIAKRLKEELAIYAIDYPYFSEEKIIDRTLSFLQRVSSVMHDFDEEDIERKMQNWIMQGELLFRWIKLDHESSLYRIVEEKWNENPSIDPSEFVFLIHLKFLQKYPKLIPYAKDIEVRIWIFFKYFWYTRGFKEITPTFERFLQWHKKRLLSSEFTLDQKIEKLEVLSKKMLPLMPLSKAKIRAILTSKKEEKSY